MKKLFLAALAVTIGFASCSKDPGVETSDDGYVSISLNFAENFTKGEMDDITGDEIQDAVTVTGQVYVFIAQKGTLLVKEPVALGTNSTPPFTHKTKAGEKTDDDRLTKDIDQIIIIGNAPADFAGKVTNMATVAELKKVYYDLEAAQDDYMDKKIWVQGEAEKKDIKWDDAPTPGGSDAADVTKGEVTISLHPVLSRMDVTVNLTGVEDGIFASKEALAAYRNTQIGDDRLKGGIVIQSVSVLYSASQSALVDPYTPDKVDGDDDAKAAFLSGLDITGYTSWSSGAHGYSTKFGNTDDAETFLFAKWLGTDWYGDTNPNNNASQGTINYVPNGAGADAVNKGTFKRTFYAFSPKNYEASSNLGTTANYKPYTIITIHAKQYKVEENGSSTIVIDENADVIDRFFSVTFDGKGTLGDTETELQPGTRYEVGLNLSGDFSEGGGGGFSPEDKGYANLTITVKPAKWKAGVPVNKDFTGN